MIAFAAEGSVVDAYVCGAHGFHQLVGLFSPGCVGHDPDSGVHDDTCSYMGVNVSHEYLSRSVNALVTAKP